MTGDTAKGLENLIAVQLVRRYRVGFTHKPSIEAAARRNQRAFECRDRIQHRRNIRLPSISVAELADHFWICAQFADDLVNARSHDSRIAKALVYAFFERAEIPFPIQAKVQADIEHSRRI